MVSTLGTLREGVTLHRARIIVVHDLHWVLNHLLQVEARIHRIGQLRPCQSVWMLAKDSIDTLLAPLLLTKARYAEELLGITAGADALAELELDTTIPQQTVGDHVERLLNAWRA
jgi:SNF2 family DNA or RNA helicase